MPTNSRPKKFFDPYRQNQSLAEIEDAQNQWDLLNAQETANRLKQQQMQEERENAEMIADATIQAEEDRFNNQKE